MLTGGSDEEAATLSPNTRVKLLCSYGGKILPRPTDGRLKYVGGETRVVSVPRTINFKELKEKITGIFSHPGFVIKYQVFPEDLDALVSVRSDEDLLHMLEEYDRHDSLPGSPSSSSRFRIILFPSPSATPPCTSPTYLDSINGSANGSISPKDSLSIPIPSKPPMFTISSSSAYSSPTDSSPIKGFGLLGMGPKSGNPGMQRVRSTPNLSGSSGHFGNNHSGTNLSPRGGFYTHHHHHHHQQPHQNKGITGYGGSGMSRMGGSHRHETCGCTSGCGCAFSGHQSQRRYYYPPSGGHSCGCRGGGHGEETRTPRSSHSSISGSGMLPIASRKSIWE